MLQVDPQHRDAPDTMKVNYHPRVCFVSALTPCLKQWLAHSGCSVNICRREFLL